MQKLPVNFFPFLLALVIATSACASSTPSPAETQLPVPPPATVISTLTVTEPSLVPQQSPTFAPTAPVEGTIATPAGLRIVYLRDGDLWMWTAAGGKNLLTDTGDISTIDLSPDGQLLAFMRGAEVWTVRMDGTDARMLAHQPQQGGALWFAPNNSLLAVSTADHIDVLDLNNATMATVISYPALPEGYYPEVVWSPDGSGLKTIIPPASESGQAEFFYIFTSGTAASLAKFSMVPPAESHPFISPDGGYVIYVAKSGDGQESLFLMDSSGATRPYGEPGKSIRAYGWLPDSKNFVYAADEAKKGFMGNVKGEPPVEIAIQGYSRIRWIDSEHYLGALEGDLSLGDINGENLLIDENVTDFDFGV